MNNTNWNKIEGYWTQLQGKVKEEWNDLTNDEIEEMAGRREQLIGKIQAKCGCTREEAEFQVNGWTDRMANEEPWTETGMTKDAQNAAAGGAAAGAIVGGAAGAMVGPGGAIAGAAIGAVAGGLGSGAAVQEVDKHDNDGSPGEKKD